LLLSTLTAVTDDGHVVSSSPTTYVYMLSPAPMSTSCYSQLVASTIQIAEPDWSRSAPIVVT